MTEQFRLFVKDRRAANGKPPGHGQRWRLSQLGTLCTAAVLFVATWSCGGPAVEPLETANTGREPIVGLPCEGCEAVFQGLPDALTWSARIASPDEPGEVLQIEGTVRDKAGHPMPGIIVYAYHTDALGLYPTDPSTQGTEAYRHGRLRGWARTDPTGRYRFDTIRPVGYPNTDIPAHVHMHVLEPGRCTYYIDDILFEEDPRLTEAMRDQLIHGRGGPGVVTPLAGPSGSWSVTRDIVLGQRIPGYPEDPNL